MKSGVRIHPVHGSGVRTSERPESSTARQRGMLRPYPSWGCCNHAACVLQRRGNEGQGKEQSGRKQGMWILNGLGSVGRGLTPQKINLETGEKGSESFHLHAQKPQYYSWNHSVQVPLARVIPADVEVGPPYMICSGGVHSQKLVPGDWDSFHFLLHSSHRIFL